MAAKFSSFLIVVTALLAACNDAAGPPVPQPSKLAFLVAPVPTEGTVVIDPPPEVAIQDDAGNTITTATHGVTIALGPNSRGATLTGTTTVYAVAGVARFRDLRIDRPGEHTLIASVPELAGATSAPFRVSLTLTAVRAGGSHTCAITTARATYCWGLNLSGQLGDGTTTHSAIPVLVASPPGVEFVSVNPGTQHTCGIATDGTAYCWGSGGLLGNGTSSPSKTPVPVTAPSGTTFASLTVNTNRACGITASGEAYCWGANSYLGELGDGTTESRSTPTRVAAPAAVRFRELSAGYSHTCGATTADEIYCWGWPSGPTLVLVAMPQGVTLVAVAPGMADTCGLSSTGAGYCWGDNMHGQLGDGTNTPHASPGPVTMPAGVEFAEVRAGWEHNCGLSTGGLVYCWGRAGLTGDGTVEQRRTPVPIVAPPGARFVSVSVGGNHTCALLAEGIAYCWGQNDGGKLGNGELTGFASAPVRVTQ